jgi:hypothetical protein
MEEVAFVRMANKLLHAGTRLDRSLDSRLEFVGGKSRGTDGQGDESSNGDDHGLFHGSTP